MPCTPFSVGGVRGIVCTSRRPQKRCGTCGTIAGFQCDWKVGGGKTCDAHLCGAHATEVAADKHLCPQHRAAYAQWQAQRAIKKAAAV